MLSDFRKLLFNNSCIHCNEPLILKEEVLCFSCYHELQSFKLTIKQDLFACHSIESIISTYLYYQDSPVQSIISTFKYKGLKKVGKWMAFDIYSKINLDKFDSIVYVPMHKKKIKERGFNQTEIIAKQLSELSGIPVKELLYRSSNMGSQTRESKFSRFKRSNEVYKRVQNAETGLRNILLFDDVFTSGSTLISCANELKRSHKASITALTFAFTPEEQSL